MEIKLEEAAFGADKQIEIEKLDACDKCGGSGAEPGSRRTRCPTCAGRGQVVSSRGFFHISQTCPRCHGAGEIIEKPCQKCRGEGRGDLFARLIVEVSSRLNAEQRRKLEEFAALCGEENTPMRKSFFERAKEFFK